MDTSYGAAASGDFGSSIVPAFGNLGHTVHAILSNFSSLVAISGIKTEKESTSKPLLAILVMEFCLILGVNAATVR